MRGERIGTECAAVSEAKPEPPETNACPLVPAEPVSVNAVVMLGDASVAVVMVGDVPNTLAPVPVIVEVEM